MGRKKVRATVRGSKIIMQKIICDDGEYRTSFIHIYISIYNTQSIVGNIYDIIYVCVCAAVEKYKG